MPAEWAVHERTLIAWPCRRELWGERLEEARRSGAEWVTLFDDVTPFGSHRLEMHVRSGRGLHASCRRDVDRPATYSLEVVQLDPRTGAWLLDETLAIVALAHDAGAIVIVNDRADIARLSGADGVHVGQSDLAPAVVRPIVGTERVVGVSTHTVEQVDAAVLEPVDYVAVGPVFGTSTKQSAYEAVGLDRVREAARKAHARSLPVVAIGGITIDRAADVIDAGAASVAVISDLLASDDPEARVRAYLHALA